MFFFYCCWVNIPSGATPFLIRHRTIGILLLNCARCSSSSEFTSLIFEAGFAWPVFDFCRFGLAETPTHLSRHRWRRRRGVSASAAGLSLKNPSGTQLGTGQRETWRQSGLSTLGLAIIWRPWKYRRQLVPGWMKSSKRGKKKKKEGGKTGGKKKVGRSVRGLSWRAVTCLPVR